MDIQDVRRRNLGAIIEYRFEGNVSALARAVDKVPSQILDVLSSRKAFGERLARKLEDLLQIRQMTLDNINVYVSEDGSKIAVEGLQNTSPGPDIHEKRIPVISWVQAGTFCSSPDLFQPGDAEDWKPSHKGHGPHTYILRVRGDSMVSPYPGQRSYPDGTLIYVDPDKPLTNKCRVVARIHDAEEATFKEYVEDAGVRYLKPLNPQYPTIKMDETMHICGVVVLATMEE